MSKLETCRSDFRATWSVTFCVPSALDSPLANERPRVQKITISTDNVHHMHRQIYFSKDLNSPSGSCWLQTQASTSRHMAFCSRRNEKTSRAQKLNYQNINWHVLPINVATPEKNVNSSLTRKYR